MGSPDEEQIALEARRFEEAWNKGDAGAIKEFFAQDCRMVGLFGEVGNGKEEIGILYNMLLNKAIPATKLKFDQELIRMIGPGVATWQAAFRVSPSQNGKSFRGYIVNIIRKTPAGWKILESHPKIIPEEL